MKTLSRQFMSISGHKEEFQNAYVRESVCLPDVGEWFHEEWRTIV